MPSPVRGVRIDPVVRERWREAAVLAGVGLNELIKLGAAEYADGVFAEAERARAEVEAREVLRRRAFPLEVE